MGTETQPETFQDQTAATGEHTTNGTPNGFSSLTPFIAVRDTAAAIDFYHAVFDAELLSSTTMGGVIAHAELKFAEGVLQLGEVDPEFGLLPQSETDQACFSLSFYCPDAATVLDRAVQAGATVREPLAEFASGDRYASIKDPFGVRWSILTRVADLSVAESGRRVQEWADSFTGN